MVKIPYDSKTAADKLKELLAVVDDKAQVKNLEHFIYASSQLFKGQRMIFMPNTVYNGLHHLSAELIVQRKLKEKNINGSQERIEAFQVLASEYKIHIMPKPEYMLGVVAEFLLACSKNPELQRHIHAFKIRIKPINLQSIPSGTTKNQIVPQMVIYLNLGKDSANFVLKTLYQIYSEFDNNEIGLGIPARYSLAVTPLICYAQGGGDVKNTMTGSQKDTFLSQNEVHYNLLDQHLDNPAWPDLKCFAELIGKLHTITPFQFKDISVQNGCPSFMLPHIRSILELPEDPKHPGNIFTEDVKWLTMLSEVLSKTNIKGKVFNSNEVITGDNINYVKFYVVIYLPGFIPPVRNGLKSLFEECHNVFGAKNKQTDENNKKMSAEPKKDTKKEPHPITFTPLKTKRKFEESDTEDRHKEHEKQDGLEPKRQNKQEGGEKQDEQKEQEEQGRKPQRKRRRYSD